jgi:hypothetical protein
MDNYYNLSLYGTTQDDMTSSQCSAQDFMLTQNSYDLSRYTKDNQINNNSNALETIKEEDIFSQAEQLFYENEKASLQKSTYIDPNLTSNPNNKANFNKAINNNPSNYPNNFSNDYTGKNNNAPNKTSTNNVSNNLSNNNSNNINHNKNQNNAGNIMGNNSNCTINPIDEKIFLISQEIDKIEMQQKEESLKKLNLAASNQNNNNNNFNNNPNAKNLNNLAVNKILTNNNNNNNSNSFANNNTNKPNSSNQNANSSGNFTNNPNNQKANKLSTDLMQVEGNLNFKAKADFNTEKKQSVQKNYLYDQNLNLNNSDGIADNLNQELFLKIKSVTDNFLTKYDAYSNKIHNYLDNYKRTFLNDVNLLYLILKEETVYIVSEEEKNRVIDEKIKIIFNEMIGVFSQISPKGI